MALREKQKSISPGQMTNYSFSLKPRRILKSSASFKKEVGNRKDLNMTIFLDIMLKQYPEDQKKYPNKEKLNKDQVAKKVKNDLNELQKSMR